MIVTLAGHVDHGKTAIVHALTGTNTDRLKEEQARGLTIDLGFAYTDLEGFRVGFVDVPGHHRFIHNMIAGVGTLQHALLIVAADDGIMPQTVEHVQIMELLGIQSGTIVLNKIDLVSTDQVEETKREISTFVQGTFLERAPVIEVSTQTGEGVNQLSANLHQVAVDFEQTKSNRPFRLAIDRSFSLRGIGTVVTGTVGSGVANVGDTLYLTSANRTVRVRGLNVQGQQQSQARTGDRASVNLVGVNVEEANRGAWLLHPDSVYSTSYAQVTLQVLPDFPRVIKHRAPAHIYHLTDHCEGHIALLESNSTQAGSTVLADIECSKPMHFKVGDRLIIRDRDLSRTIGGAVVLNATTNRNTRRRSESYIHRLQQVEEAVKVDDLGRALAIQGNLACTNIDSLRRLWNTDKSEVQDTVRELQLVQQENLVLSAERFERLRDRVLQHLKVYHQENKELTGISPIQISSQLKIDSETAQFVLTNLVQDKLIVTRSGSYALPSHTQAKPNYDEVLFRRVHRLVAQPQPASIGDIGKECKIPFDRLVKALQPMIAAGEFRRISHNRIFTADHYTSLISEAEELAQRGPFSVKDFRDKTGLGRNLVIDLLEYFDRQRITRREGDLRTISPRVAGN